MFYAQELLRIMIDGWQSTILAQNNGFRTAKMDAIQIHIGNVTLFDCHKVGSHLSSTLTHQLCQVYRTSICESGGNSVDAVTVQKQRGSDDCRFFLQ